MDIVENVLGFKRKWLVKLIYQISGLYETPNNDLIWEKDIDEFLADCIDSYLEEIIVSDDIIDEYYFDIDEELVNKVDINLFKIVINTFNKPKYIISNYSFMNLIFISILLECTLEIYRLSFENFKKDSIIDILENNIIGINFIKFKKKNRKINLISSYLDYIGKIEKETYSILKDDRINFNFIKLLNEDKYYIANYTLRINELSKYDDDIVNEVREDKLIDKNITKIAYQLTRLKLMLVSELNKETINKVLFIINDEINDDTIISNLNNCSKVNSINNKIVLVSKDLNKKYDTKLSIAYYYDSTEKISNVKDLQSKTVIVNNSFWKANKRNDKLFKDNKIIFITINDNINYLFKKKEVN